MRFLELAAICIAGLSVVHSQVVKPNWQPNPLGSVSQKHAAFVSIYQTDNDTIPYIDRWTLYVSTFDPGNIIANDDVYYMRSPGALLDIVADWQLLRLDKSAVWPNNPDYLPRDAVGVEGIVQTSGFLVTGKQNGQLQLFDTDTEPPSPDGGINIAANDSRDWSYHRVVWQDMDLDGDLDAVTARFKAPLTGRPDSEFMFFENPNLGMVPEWTEHVFANNGPDISFTPVTLTVRDGLTYDAFICAEFFAQRLTVYWTTNNNGDWTNVFQVEQSIVDPIVGQVFDVVIEDVNRDGVDDLLLTTYDTEEKNGTLRVYFFPDDFRYDPWTYEVIASGFVPHETTFGETMSPGSMLAYYPTREYMNDMVAADGLPHKPFILLSGDDDGQFYIVEPENDIRTDWTYTTHTLIAKVGEDDIAGTMAAVDLDDDGFTELVMALYTMGQVVTYSYAP